MKGLLLLFATVIIASAQTNVPYFVRGKPIVPIRGIVFKVTPAILYLSNYTTHYETVQTGGGGVVKRANGTIGVAPVQTAQREVHVPQIIQLVGHPQQKEMKEGDRVDTTGIFYAKNGTGAEVYYWAPKEPGQAINPNPKTFK